MFYVIHDSTSGAFVAVATDVSGLPASFGAVPYEDAPDMAANVWDAGQRMLVPRPAPTPAVLSRISRQTFMDRLGEACTVGMQVASVTFPGDSTQVQQAKAALRDTILRFQIVQEIDVLDPRTIANVDRLIAGGLLAANRRAAVLALPTPDGT